jgi:hypothetical protein
MIEKEYFFFLILIILILKKILFLFDIKININNIRRLESMDKKGKIRTKSPHRKSSINTYIARVHIIIFFIL